ncbi:hypothetical protein L596_019910 [Steinernema carpocapsae]|uniref:ShKT domain-containing protein n=1 Tax=Steinernema carpocapsae TaxID=34508 RepID=A0A4U5MST9_STECR|nr:hypothetical protein L596_019910 [Steinernema carpocapsae]
MQFQLLIFVIFVFVPLAYSFTCILGECPVNFRCINNFCVNSSPPCVDVAPADCQRSKANCNDSLWFDVMTKQCAKTCGRCGGPDVPGIPGDCRDKNSTECANKAYLCKNAQYNDNSQFNVMKDQCPKTCGYCR